MAQASKQQAAASTEDELPQDQNTDGQDAAVLEDRAWSGALAALHGTTDSLHAIQVRLAEMRPFLTGAIEQADGQLKGFLISLHASL